MARAETTMDAPASAWPLRRAGMGCDGVLPGGFECKLSV